MTIITQTHSPSSQAHEKHSITQQRMMDVYCCCVSVYIRTRQMQMNECNVRSHHLAQRFEGLQLGLWFTHSMFSILN